MELVKHDVINKNISLNCISCGVAKTSGPTVEKKKKKKEADLRIWQASEK